MLKSGIKIGGIYQHYKGKFYTVIDVAYHNETLDKPIVVYHRCDENGIYKSIRTFDEIIPQPFYRDLKEFNEKINTKFWNKIIFWNKKEVQRFKLIK